MKLSSPQKNLTKNLRRNWMLEQLLLFAAYSIIKFFNSFFVTYGVPCHPRGHPSHLVFCDLRDTILCQRLLLPSLTTFVTYSKPCHATGQHSHFSFNPYLGRQRMVNRLVIYQFKAEKSIIHPNQQLT